MPPSGGNSPRWPGTMFRFDSWWFPDGELQLPAVMATQNVRVDERLTWQYHKYAAALSLCPPERRRFAFDVGAHIGLWSYWMARDFIWVGAFEPIEEHRQCWMANMLGWENHQLYPVALGANQVSVSMDRLISESGGAHIAPNGIDVDMRTLDSFDFPVVDLLKIDVEGFEPAVLLGARDTIQRCRPIIILEDVPRVSERYAWARSVHDLLAEYGMQRRTTLGSDAIYEWPDNGIR